MKKKTNTMMILFILIVVVLSVVFTWKALEATGTLSKTTAESKDSIEDMPTSGRIGINLIQPELNEGTEAR